MNMNDLHQHFTVINTTVLDTNKNPLHYSFTKGLNVLGMKEMCVYGMSPASAVEVLNHLAVIQQKGELKIDHKYSEFLVGFDLIVKEVPASNSIKRFGVSPPCTVLAREMLQVVWPDEQNIFPWEEGFDERQRHLQYRLYD